MKSAVVLYSGGQDSTTCLLWALKHYGIVKAVAFDYGQLHKVELLCAKRICHVLGVELSVLDAPIMQPRRGDNVVIGRNTVLITLAAIFAAELDVDDIIIGSCKSDHELFVDCRPSFITSIEQALRLGVNPKLSIVAPLNELDKAQVFELADSFGGLDLVLTSSHTCYNGDRSTLNAWGYGCGLCLACRVREHGYITFKGED